MQLYGLYSFFLRIVFATGSDLPADRLVILCVLFIELDAKPSAAKALCFGDHNACASERVEYDIARVSGEKEQALHKIGRQRANMLRSGSPPRTLLRDGEVPHVREHLPHRIIPFGP